MAANELYEVPLHRIDGQATNLGAYKGKVMLIVNVASKCGLTPQYDGLEQLYQQFHEQGLEVLGFPANEFGAQEPGTNQEIQEFCRTSFGVQFPMFQKVVVKGEQQHPLYRMLTTKQPDAKKNPTGKLEEALKKHGQEKQKPNDILWNFEKFLINRKGEVVERFAPDVSPEDPMLINAIESALNA